MFNDSMKKRVHRIVNRELRARIRSAQLEADVQNLDDHAETLGAESVERIKLAIAQGSARTHADISWQLLSIIDAKASPLLTHVALMTAACGIFLQTLKADDWQNNVLTAIFGLFLASGVIALLGLGLGRESKEEDPDSTALKQQREYEVANRWRTHIIAWWSAIGLTIAFFVIVAFGFVDNVL